MTVLICVCVYADGRAIAVRVAAILCVFACARARVSVASVRVWVCSVGLLMESPIVERGSGQSCLQNAKGAHSTSCKPDRSGGRDMALSGVCCIDGDRSGEDNTAWGMA